MGSLGREGGAGLALTGGQHGIPDSTYYQHTALGPRVEVRFGKEKAGQGG